jgi:hypothetical protein
VVGTPPSTEHPENTVFLTKARVAPWELEDRVLTLMDAVMQKPIGEHVETTNVGA